jgi:hypothetical protein
METDGDTIPLKFAPVKKLGTVSTSQMKKWILETHADGDQKEKEVV